jgi:hypothetical protein
VASYVLEEAEEVFAWHIMILETSKAFVQCDGGLVEIGSLPTPSWGMRIF